MFHEMKSSLPRSLLFLSSAILLAANSVMAADAQIDRLFTAMRATEVAEILFNTTFERIHDSKKKALSLLPNSDAIVDSARSIAAANWAAKPSMQIRFAPFYNANFNNEELQSLTKLYSKMAQGDLKLEESANERTERKQFEATPLGKKYLELRVEKTRLSLKMSTDLAVIVEQAFLEALSEM